MCGGLSLTKCGCVAVFSASREAEREAVCASCCGGDRSWRILQPRLLLPSGESHVCSLQTYWWLRIVWLCISTLKCAVLLKQRVVTCDLLLSLSKAANLCRFMFWSKDIKVFQTITLLFLVYLVVMSCAACLLISLLPRSVNPGLAAGGPRGGGQETKGGRKNRETAGCQQRRHSNRGADDDSISSVICDLFLMSW